MDDPRVNPGDDDNFAIRTFEDLKRFIVEGNTQAVEQALLNTSIDPGADDNFAIRFASKKWVY